MAVDENYNKIWGANGSSINTGVNSAITPSPAPQNNNTGGTVYETYVGGVKLTPDNPNAPFDKQNYTGVERDNNTYDVLNGDGKLLGTIKRDDNSRVAKNSGADVYAQQGSKIFSTRDEYIKSFGISMSDDGNITVNAPKSFTDSKYYKEQLKPTLLALSQAQKINPNTKFAMTSNQNDVRTAKDWIELQSQELPKNVRQQMTLDKQKEAYKNMYRSDFSDNDVITANSATIKGKDAQGNDITPNQNDRQAIPDMPEFSYFSSLPGYDKNTHTIDYKSLTEAYSNDKLTDEQIIAIKNAVEHKLNFLEKNKTHNVPARDIAELISFKRYLDNTDASTNFWTGARHAITDNLMGIVEGVFDTASAPSRFIFNVIDPHASDEYLKWKKDLEKNRNLVNRTSAGLAGYTEAGAQILSLMVLGQALTGALTGAAASAVASIGKAGSIGVSWFNATKYAQGLQKVLDSSRGMELLGKAINTLQAGGKTAKVAGEVGKLIAETVVESALMNPEMTARFVRDTNDEEARKYILEQGAQNTAFFLSSNLTKWVGTKIKYTETGQALNIRAKHANAGIANTLNKWTDKFREVLHISGDDIAEKAKDYKNKLDKIPNPTAMQKNKLTRLQKKSQILATNKMQHMATKELAEVKLPFKWRNKEAYTKGLEKFANTEIGRKMLISNLVDNIQSGGRKTFAMITKTDLDPAFREAYNNMLGDKLTALYKAEDAAGLVDKAVVDLSDFGGKGLKSLHRDTNNYIGSVIDNAVLQNKLSKLPNGADKKFLEGVSEELSERITNLKKALGNDVVEKADDYIDTLKKYDTAHADLQANTLKIRDKETLEKLRESNVFGDKGEDYFRIQRDSDVSSAFKSDKAKKLGDFQHRDPLAGGDYEDVISYRIRDLLNDANDYAKTEYIRKMKDWGYIGVTDSIIGEDLKLFNELERTKTMFKNVVDSKADTLSADFFAKHFDTDKLSKQLTDADVFDIDKVPELLGGIDKSVDSIVGELLSDKSLSSDVLKNIAKVNGANKEIVDKASEFFATKALSKHLTESHIRTRLGEALSDIAVKGTTTDELAEAIYKKFQDSLDLRTGKLAKELTEKGMTSVVAESGLYDEVKKLADKIADFKQNENVIDFINEYGQHELIATDPLTASFFNTKITGYTDTALMKINRLQSKLFRTGTTVVGGKSYINQWFKDTMNAYVLGDMKPLAKPTKAMIDTWGKDVANYLAEYDTRTFKALSDKAVKTGKSINELALNRELEMAKIASGVGTEASMYQFNKAKRIAELQEGREKAVAKFKNSVDDILDKLEAPHEFRETFLRSNVAKSAYGDALKHGYSIEQARIYAEFFGTNATTNFGRQLYHLNQLQQSVPYLGAAVNGAKSFWRIAALDPIGVSSRIMGGVILPTWYLVAQSLGNEENRKVYEQIPEYEKRGNLIFISNGQKFTIPIPEEIGRLISPARQAIENLYGVNKHTFWELAMNDLVGLSPLDMTGFTNIDRNKLISDGFLNDHIIPGFSRLVSQTTPPVVKSAIMMVTGKDPYTGRPIDTSRVSIDPDTGEPIIMDRNTGDLAKMVAGLFGKDTSPSVAQKMLSNIFGSAGMDIIDGIFELGKSVVKGDVAGGAEKILGRVGNQITSPVLGNNYDQTQKLFNQAVSALTRERDAMLNRKDLQAINQKLRYETDSDKIQKLKNQRDNILNPYYKKVLNVANNLKSEYGATMTRQRFASILGLMNLENNSASAYSGNNAFTDDLTKKAMNDGKAQALETMVKLGFKGADDMSMFGYQKKNKNGEVVTYYQQPLALLSWNSTKYLQDDIHSASITGILKEKSAFERKKLIKSQTDALYADWKNKSKAQRNADQTKIDQLWVNWNADVMKDIAPYVAKYGPEETINNSKMLNELSKYIELPSMYKSNNKGKRVYGSTLGDDGSVKDAYIKSYIRRMFNINNEGQPNGRNYSERK